MFSGGKERNPWHEMGKPKTLLLMILSVNGSSLLKFEIYYYKI